MTEKVQQVRFVRDEPHPGDLDLGGDADADAGVQPFHGRHLQRRGVHQGVQLRSHHDRRITESRSRRREVLADAVATFPIQQGHSVHVGHAGLLAWVMLALLRRVRILESSGFPRIRPVEMTVNCLVSKESILFIIVFQL